MQKEKIVQALVEFIEKTYKDKMERYGEVHEIALFSWQFTLRAILERDWGLRVDSDINRILLVEAWNRTHPHRPYTIHPNTLDNPNLTYGAL